MKENVAPEETLTSWKEIASYLGRSVRTVRRWESTEGLPIRRHLHQKASTVFALRSEIDDWQQRRIADLENPPAPAAAQEPTESTSPAWYRWAAAAAVLTVGITGGWLAHSWVDSAGGWGTSSQATETGSLENVLNGALERDIVDGAIQLCRDKHLEADCQLLRESVAQLRPDSFRANHEAAYALAAHGGDLERAAGYAERARELLNDRTVSEDAEAAAWVLLFEARRHWAEGTTKESLESSDELQETLASWPPRLRTLLARDFGTLALGLGRTETAKEWFEHISDLDYRHEMLAWYLFAEGRGPELRRHLRERIEHREPFTAILLAMVGEHARARSVIDQLEGTRLSSELARVARGAITFFEGRPDEAIAQLEMTLSNMSESGDPIFFAGSDILAMAYHQRGSLPEAIGALEMTSRQRNRAMFLSAGLFWVKCQSRLSAYYQEAGLDGERQATDDELLARLRYADVTFPVLADISKRSG